MSSFKIPGLRFWILILASLCLTSVLSNMATYNFTKICMDSKNESNEIKYHGKEHHFTTLQKSWLQSAVAIGALLASLPYTYLFQNYSHRYVFLSAGVISGVSTAVIPEAANLGFGFFLVARILQGIAFSATFPLIGAITADWATLGEHGLFIALLTGCTQLSNIFTMPVSGALCTSSWGWPAVYYLHASISVLAFSLWVLFYRNKPELHPCTTLVEQRKIEAGKEGNEAKHDNNIPYRAMLTSLTLWGVLISAFGDLVSVQLVSMFNPQYMNDYLDFSIMNSGFMAALPIIVQFIFKLIGGVSSDLITCIDETLKLRIYNSVALGLSAVFFIVLAFVPRNEKVLAVIILILAESLIGFNCAGFNKCATLHSRQYGHFVMTQIMNIWSFTMLIEPFIVNSIVTDNTAAEWRLCFLLHAGILMGSNVVFVIFADARPAAWTMGENRRNSTETEKTD